jgi:hypothetical protein
MRPQSPTHQNFSKFPKFPKLVHRVVVDVLITDRLLYQNAVSHRDRSDRHTVNKMGLAPVYVLSSIVGRTRGRVEDPLLDDGWQRQKCLFGVNV